MKFYQSSHRNNTQNANIHYQNKRRIPPKYQQKINQVRSTKKSNPWPTMKRKKKNLKIKQHLYESTDDDSETENTVTINILRNEVENEPPRSLRPLSKRISCE